MVQNKTMMKASRAATEEQPPPPPARSVMVRSLRRRLWKALQEEDVQTAIRAYTVTKVDYERWLDEEFAEYERLRKREEEKKGQKQKERGTSRSMSFRKLGSIVKMESSRRLRTAVKSTQEAEARKLQFLNDNGDTKLMGSNTQSILQSELHPNEEFVPDDFYEPHHPYDVELLSQPPTKKESASAKPKRKGPRLAGFFSWRSTPRYDWDLAEEFLIDRDGEGKIEDKVDENMTTLLHEASRVACSDFVRLLLANGGNPNVRNGQQRTCLHMVAGGLLEQESLFLDTEESSPSDVGIRTPVVDLSNEDEIDKGDKKMHKKAARAVGRLFPKFNDASSGETNGQPDSVTPSPSFGQLTSQRMDALLAVLSWVHNDDGTPSAGEGPSINSVDMRGRTALHYAAELGRTDLCLTILTSFGAILTVVDESGQTPCELSAEQKHPDLAAQLEARALLYADPYGLDEDLLASVWGGSSDDATDSKKKKKKKRSGSKLMPPFSWYETWQMDKVRSERQARASKLFEQMQEVLIMKQEDRDSKEFMYNHGFDDSMEDATLNSDVAIATSNTINIDVTATPVKHLPKEIVSDSTEEVTLHSYAAIAAAKMTDNNATETPLPKKDFENSMQEATLNSIAAVAAANTTSSSAVETPAKPLSVEESDAEDTESKFSEAAEKESEADCKDKGGPYKSIAGDASQEKQSDESSTAVEHETQEDGEEASKPERAVVLSEEDNTMIKTVDMELVKAAGKDRFAQSVAAKPPSELQVLSTVLQEAHVERFAAFHLWNTSAALRAFQENPLVALNEAGLDIGDEELQTNTNDGDTKQQALACLICCDMFNAESTLWVDLSGCDHGFCLECLGDYVSECARSRETGAILDCPHHTCSVLLSPVEIERLSPSPDVYESLLVTSDENFVATAEDVCFCPHPGCDGVVRRVLPAFVASAKLDRSLINLSGAVCTGGHNVKVNEEECPSWTYEGVHDPNYTMTRNAVQPKRAHRFCFSCGSQNMHWPVQCELLGEWKDKIANEIGDLDEPEEGEGDNVTFNDVAQRLWLKANTRPCPKCKASIEKDDGCNHMTCSNRSCRHEFCWICREDWKLHNTETGGFFRCNRWQDDDSHKYYDTPPPPEHRTPESNTVEALSPSEVNYGTALHSSRVAWKKSKEMGLFLHHYRRWTAHRESASLEKIMAETVCSRLGPVVEAAIDFNGHDHFDFGGKGLSFIHGAFTELLECRSLLQHSYAFAYFRYPIQYHMRRTRSTKSKEREKAAFEQLQSELEMLTEQTSDIVARKHLRATQMQIMFLTNGACQKRSELTSFMLSLLNAQIKEDREEAERIKKEKSRPTVDRIPDMGSLFHFSTRQYPVRHPHQQHREHVSTRLRRLMDNQYTTRRDRVDDSDEEDDYRIHPGRTRNERAGEEAIQDAFRSSVQTFFHNIGENEETGRFQDWACVECTYMNAGGRRCAMCGNARR